MVSTTLQENSQLRFKRQEVKVLPNQKEIKCLVENMYHEARGETLLGAVLVAQVTLNRAKLANSSICNVVYKPYQFSWTLQKKSIKDRIRYWYMQDIALMYLSGYYSVPQQFKNVTHYYSHKLIKMPRWASRLKEAGKEGNHTFYTAEKEVSYMKQQTISTQRSN